MKHAVRFLTRMNWGRMIPVLLCHLGLRLNAMKLTINCDHVFEILTRGPFPSGDPQDAAVEMHLLACHECRELAEALRPAVDLFHESIPVGEQEELPGYRGALCRLTGESSRERVGTLMKTS